MENGCTQITARALEVFGDVQIAKSWLREQNPALAGEIPLDLVDTEAGVKQVDTVLGRIEHGIFC